MFFKALLFLLICLVIGSCQYRDSASKNLPVVVVNGETLSASAFAQLLGKKLKTFDALAAKDPTNVRRSKEMIIKDFIVSSLLRQYAAEKKMTVTEEEFTQEFNRIRNSYPDDLGFKGALAEDGIPLDDWKSRLRNTILERKTFSLIGSTYSEAELTEAAKGYYQDHKSDFQRPAEVHIKQIVVSKKDDAERLLTSIKKGASFESLAKKYSVSPDAAEGGDIGYVAKGVVSAFDNAFNYKIGQLSPVIKSSYGFHIIKLIDKRAAVLLTFEQAKDRIVKIILSQKQQEAFSEWLQNQVKKSKIERSEPLINKISVRTEGTQE